MAEDDYRPNPAWGWDWSAIAANAMANFRPLGFIAPGLPSYAPPSQRVSPVSLPAMAPEGQMYLHPTGNLSNISGPGATLVPSADAMTRAAGLKAGAPAGAGVTFSPGDITDAANTLADAKEPTTPQFIQPYQRVTGPGAFGERDINY